jgi:hypothetical protein
MNCIEIFFIAFISDEMNISKADRKKLAHQIILWLYYRDINLSVINSKLYFSSSDSDLYKVIMKCFSIDFLILLWEHMKFWRKRKQASYKMIPCAYFIYIQLSFINGSHHSSSFSICALCQVTKSWIIFVSWFIYENMHDFEANRGGTR